MSSPGFRYNSPPNWPPPPLGWVPPEGWHPDPSWPPAPEGWQFWLPINASPAAEPKNVERPEPGVLVVRGYNGQVRWDGTFVTITRAGVMGRLSVGKGEKRIPLGSISAVQLKPAGPLVSGFISFALPGGVERRSKFGQQTQDAMGDENSVVFRQHQQAAFELLRGEIEAAIAARHAPVVPGAHVVQSAPDLADQLSKLAVLRDQGVLTDEEFQRMKGKLLDS